MIRTIFYRKHELTGRFEGRWQDRDGVDRRDWVPASRWQDFVRQWTAYGYTFIESDFGDGQDRR